MEDSTDIETKQEIWDKTVAENIFVLCKTQCKSITKVHWWVLEKPVLYQIS
jgi:hypothetical protein